MLEFQAISRRTTRIAFALLTAFILSASLSTAQAQNEPVTFTSNLYNIENTAKETFRYNATLKNNTTTASTYSLRAEAPAGWRVAFKIRGSNVTAIKLERKKTESINIELAPAFECAPGTYQVPVSAISDKDTLGFTLEAVVKGNYEVALSTPTGLVSGEVVEGKKLEFTLQVKNTGTLPLKDLSLSSRTPSKWEASFEPQDIDQLEPGKTKDVQATITVPDKTLPGDYISKFTVKSTDANDNIDFRVKVETSILAGWVGMLIIALAIGIVVFLIRKFGRR